jgi:hypothetical protein
MQLYLKQVRETERGNKLGANWIFYLQINNKQRWGCYTAVNVAFKLNGPLLFFE